MRGSRVVDGVGAGRGGSRHGASWGLTKGRKDSVSEKVGTNRIFRPDSMQKHNSKLQEEIKKSLVMYVAEGRKR